jgi:hypothetical protein
MKQHYGINTHYSHVRTLHRESKSLTSLNIYPNPVIRNIQLQFDDPLSGTFIIELFNHADKLYSE